MTLKQQKKIGNFYFHTNTSVPAAMYAYKLNEKRQSVDILGDGNFYFLEPSLKHFNQEKDWFVNTKQHTYNQKQSSSQLSNEKDHLKSASTTLKSIKGLSPRTDEKESNKTAPCFSRFMSELQILKK